MILKLKFLDPNFFFLFKFIKRLVLFLRFPKKKQTKIDFVLQQVVRKSIQDLNLMVIKRGN